MRVLMFDIDTLRADHMGCYGYGRDTTPMIDEIAKEGVRQLLLPQRPLSPIPRLHDQRSVWNP